MSKRKPARQAYGHKDRKQRDFLPLQTPTYWNGEPATCVRGTAIVIAPLEYEGNRMPVVLVSVGSVSPFVLLDRGGQAWMKVTIGRGSPAYGHRDVSIDRESFVAT